jgi:putative phosphotransacetylase
MRHLHLSSGQAGIYGLKNGDIIRLQSDGPRRVTLENVVVRAGDGHEMEVHLDFDEANGAMIRNGDLLKIVNDPCEER